MKSVDASVNKTLVLLSYFFLSLFLLAPSQPVSFQPIHFQPCPLKRHLAFRISYVIPFAFLQYVELLFVFLCLRLFSINFSSTPLSLQLFNS